MGMPTRAMASTSSTNVRNPFFRSRLRGRTKPNRVNLIPPFGGQGPRLSFDHERVKVSANGGLGGGRLMKTATVATEAPRGLSA